MLNLEKEIHDILFPERAFNFEAFKQESDNEDKAYKNWLNARCDVLAMWCHIWHECDVFVTTDTNFHKATKVPRLERLGASLILRPEQARDRIALD
jgi:hypothetical protein